MLNFLNNQLSRAKKKNYSVGYCGYDVKILALSSVFFFQKKTTKSVFLWLSSFLGLAFIGEKKKLFLIGNFLWIA